MTEQSDLNNKRESCRRMNHGELWHRQKKEVEDGLARSKCFIDRRTTDAVAVVGEVRVLFIATGHQYH